MARRGQAEMLHANSIRAGLVLALGPALRGPSVFLDHEAMEVSAAFLELMPLAGYRMHDDRDGSTGAAPVVFVPLALLGERLLGA